MTEELDPGAALALAERTRERMAARATTPAWYAPLYGAFSGLFVAGFGLPQPFGIVIAAVAMIAIGLLYLRWTQLSGLIVMGYRSGATRVIAIVLTFALIGLALAGLAMREELGLVWGPIACGVVGGLFAAFASAAWDRAWRKESDAEAGNDLSRSQPFDPRPRAAADLRHPLRDGRGRIRPGPRGNGGE